MWKQPSLYRKALVGAGAAGLAALATALTDGVSVGEWGTVAGAVVVGGLAVFQVRNKEQEK